MLSREPHLVDHLDGDDDGDGEDDEDDDDGDVDDKHLLHKKPLLFLLLNHCKPEKVKMVLMKIIAAILI